jgi:predicted secreted protein
VCCIGAGIFWTCFDAGGKLISSKFTGFTTEYRGGRAAQQKILSVGPDASFSVLLPGNRTTGYSWTIDSSSPTDELWSVNHTYESSGTLIGAGGKSAFRFTRLPTAKANWCLATHARGKRTFFPKRDWRLWFGCSDGRAVRSTASTTHEQIARRALLSRMCNLLKKRCLLGFIISRGKLQNFSRNERAKVWQVCSRIVHRPPKGF